MACVAAQHDTSYPHVRCAALSHAIGCDVCDFVLVRVRVAGEHLLPLLGLLGDAFFRRQGAVFAVGHTPDVPWEQTAHVPVLRVDDEVDVWPAELFEGVVDLGAGVSAGTVMEVSGRGLTFVVTICLSQE